MELDLDVRKRWLDELKLEKETLEKHSDDFV